MSIDPNRTFEEPVALIGHGGFCEELAPSGKRE